MLNNSDQDGHRTLAVLLEGATIQVDDWTPVEPEAEKDHPIVFVHAGVADRRMWRHQVAEFATTHRVVAYDMRGFGESTVGETNHAPWRDLQETFTELGIGLAHFVGCSKGGEVILDLVVRDPDLAASVTLVGASVSGWPAAGREASPLDDELKEGLHIG